MKKYLLYLMSLCALAMLLSLQAAQSLVPKVTLPPKAGKHVTRICKDSQGNHMAVWCQNTAAGKYAIFGSVLRDDVWQTPDKLSPDYAKHVKFAKPLAPQICCDAPLHAIVTWVAFDATLKPVIFATAYIPGKPTTIDTISGSARYIRHPSICSNTAGKALIIWQQDDDQGHDAIYKAIYTPDQPVKVTGLEKVHATDGTTKINLLRVRCHNNEATVMWHEHTVHANGTHMFNVQAPHNLNPHDWFTHGMGMHTVKITL